MIDSDNYCFYLNDTNNLIDSCEAYLTEDAGGYFFLVEGNYNTVQNSIAKMLTVAAVLGGQGFGSRNGQYNNFINCESHNINYPFYCRWPNTAFNTFTNCTVYEKNGFVLRDGAHDNTFENCKVINGDYGIGFFDSIEEGQNDPCAYNNTIKNCTFYNLDASVFHLHVAPGNYASTVQNNKFINCSASDALYMFKDAMPSSGNEIINFIFEDVTSSWLDPNNTGTAYPLNFSFNYCNLYNTPAWPANPDTSNIMELPPIFQDKATGDLHLRSSSPCIDAGTATNAPSTDFEGDSRPMGNAVDMGADETAYTQKDVFYVSLTGNDSNDGTTEGTAWRTINYAANSVVAGDLVHIKAGNYGDEKIDFPYSGKVNNPIIFRGYQTSPGDNPTSTYQPGDPLDANLMPLLEGSDTLGRAFDLTGRDYIELRNFQLSAYQSGIHSESGADYNTISNIVGVRFGRIEDLVTAFGIYMTGTNNTIENSIITDAGNYCFFIDETNNTINNCTAYGNEYAGNEVDYYFHIKGDNNTISNCVAKELYNLGYDSGHGIGAREGANNTFTNCEAYDLNYPIYARWSAAANNTFNDCTVYRGNGFILRDGAHDNTFNNCKTVDSVMGVRFQDSTEEGQNDPCATNNTFNNCTFQHVTGNMFDLGSVTYNSSVTNNKFINCTVVSPTNLFKDLMPSSGNLITNCIVTDVDNFIQLGNGPGQTLGFIYRNCDFFDTPAFPSGSDTMNMIHADPLFVDAANHDYHIQNASPCSNTGTSTNAPSTDFEGDSRPYGSFYDIGIDENTAVLPLDLIEFTAVRIRDFVKLNWTTVNEFNSDYFILQKSSNNSEWTDLTRIEGAGISSEERHYHFKDEKPYSGINYYRVKFYDFDGNFEYSAVLSVNFGLENALKIFPNPADDQIRISTEKGSFFEIFNVAGIKVLESDSPEPDISGLDSGTYFISVKNELGQEIGYGRFVKN